MLQSVDFEIVHKNQTEPIIFYVRNTLTKDLEDVSGLSSWRLIDIANDTQVHTGTFIASGSVEITRLNTGIYQYQFNAAQHTGEYIFSLRLTMTNEVVGQDIFIKSHSSKAFAYAAQLREQVDKARKSVSDDIENEDQPDFTPSVSLLYGYQSKNLIFYLERGCQLLNVIPPYTGWEIDTYPFRYYGSVLIDAATIAALEAQGVFAIDTDFNYSLGGNQLVISHFEKLSSHLNYLLARFQKEAVAFKQLYRTKGGILFQFLPGGIRSARMLNSFPGGFWSRMLSSVQQ
jgi:hypothetical protein